MTAHSFRHCNQTILDSLNQGFSDLIHDLFARIYHFGIDGLVSLRCDFSFYTIHLTFSPAPCWNRNETAELYWKGQYRGINTMTRNLPEKGKLGTDSS